MTLPAAWTTVPVTWTIGGQNGEPANGTVRFTSAQVVEADGGTYVPAPIDARVVDGVLEPVSLPSTQDPSITPNGWTWRVAPLLHPQGPAAFEIEVPVVGSLNLATVVPVTSPEPLPAVAVGDSFMAARVADATSATRAAVDAVVEQAVESHTPGIELGYAERATTFTSTTNAAITTLSITVTGTGRPIEVTFFCTRVWHSVANTLVAARIRKDSVIMQEGSIISPLTTAGPSLLVRHIETLGVGVQATYDVQVFQGAAGTMTFSAASNTKMLLTAVSR